MAPHYVEEGVIIDRHNVAKYDCHGGKRKRFLCKMVEPDDEEAKKTESSVKIDRSPPLPKTAEKRTKILVVLSDEDGEEEDDGEEEEEEDGREGEEEEDDADAADED
ncbi:hypothetical protein R1sor_022378 [Riccia sorocarpa]|uniref:Uncharacterized protein n=1 Tax=Riccia sorocarpa TaxID=122646 RepID=A0ABD3GLN9_9MARC